MTGRRLWLALVVAAVAAASAAGLASCRRTLLLNNARYLMHQGRWEEARTRLERAREAGADGVSTAFPLARIAAATGEPAEAEALLRSVPAGAESLFLAAACAFEMNDEERAERLFRQALDSDGPALGSAARRIATAAVSGGMPPGPEPRLSPTEAILWNAYAGRTALGEARFAEAARHLSRAAALGTRNQSTRRAGAAALAASGDFSAARRVADQNSSPTEFLRRVMADATRLADAGSTASLSLHDAQRSRQNRAALRLAALWAEAVRAQEVATTAALEAALARTDQLLKEAPDSAAGAMLRADLLDALGRPRDAWLQCQAVLELEPVLSVAVRAADYAGDARALEDAEAGYAAAPGSVALLGADDFSSSCARRLRDGLAFLTSCSATARFDAPADGDYEIAAIARGDRAFGLSPLAVIAVDGVQQGEIYIARDGWDCYAVQTTLTKGAHEIQIGYVNNSERLRTPDEDRNLYLRSVLVARAGAR